MAKPDNLVGRKWEPSPSCCPLASTHAPWNASTQAHTNKLINLNNGLKNNLQRKWKSGWEGEWIDGWMSRTRKTYTHKIFIYEVQLPMCKGSMGCVLRKVLPTSLVRRLEHQRELTPDFNVSWLFSSLILFHHTSAKQTGKWRSLTSWDLG